MSSTITFDNFKQNAGPKTAIKWQPRLLVVAPLLLMGFGSVVPFGDNAPLLSALTGHKNAASKLTIIARADGTFDIKEFPKANQWFAPDVVGEGLTITAAERFGKKIQPSSINVMVKADPGASGEAIRVALVSARAQGFARFGFTDPNVGEVVKQLANTPSSVVAAQ
jgi:hypothetical protein